VFLTLLNNSKVLRVLLLSCSIQSFQFFLFFLYINYAYILFCTLAGRTTSANERIICNSGDRVLPSTDDITPPTSVKFICLHLHRGCTLVHVLHVYVVIGVVVVEKIKSNEIKDVHICEHTNICTFLD